MATTVTHIVDPDGGAGHDYDSLSLWEAGEQGDLTGVRDEIAVAKCRCTGGTSDVTLVVIDGWTTSATQYIKIWTDPAESYRHNGTYQTGNKYRLECGVYVVVDNYESNTIFDGLQLKQIVSGYAGWTLRVFFNRSGSSNVKLSNSILAGVYSGGADQSSILETWGGLTAWNCIVTGGIWWGIRSEDNSSIYNLTILNCGLGMSSYGSTLLAKNCLVSSCTTPAGGTFRAGTDYNATNQAVMGYTVTGEGNINDHVSHTFTFLGADDFHLASTDVGAINLGVSDPGSGLFSDDIDGQTRGATWDIGADEYVAGGYMEGVDGIGPLLAGAASRFAMLNRDLGGDF
jgi:hypothetical protein